MLEIFSYGFMIRAFLAGFLISIMAPVIGSFLVAKRYSLISDTLAHVSLAGIALGLFIGVNPFFTALIITVISAVIIDKIRKDQEISGETALSMFLSFGLALAIVLIGISKGFKVDIFSYLFGSISTVSQIELLVMLPLTIAVLATIILYYRQFLFIVFDEEVATVYGIKTKKLNLLLMLLTAIVVTLSIRIVGVLLIGALMVIPVVTAGLISRSFKQSIFLSIVFSLLAVISGLFLAYYLNLPAGGVIVLFSLFVFGITLLLKH